MIKRLKSFEEYLIIPLFCVMLFLAFLQVVSRFLLPFSLPWLEELLRFLFIWSIMLGSSIGIQRGSHIGVDMFRNFLPTRFLDFVIYASYTAIIVFSVLMIKTSYPLLVLQYSSNQLSAAMKAPMYLGTLAIPVGFTLIMIRSIQMAFEYRRGKNKK